MTDGNKFRIYPTKAQKQTLLRWIGCQRFVYNAKVQEDRYFRRFKRKSPSLVGEEIPVDQQYSHFKADAPFLKEVPSQILRNGAYRWRNAHQRFITGAADGRPNLKKRHGRQSVMITSELFQMKNDGEAVTLHLGTKSFPLGSIKVNAHRRFKGVPKSLSVSVDCGRWYVGFSLDDGKQEEPDAEIAARLVALGADALARRAVGVDLGIAIPAATSDNEKFVLDDVQVKRIKKAERYRRRWQRVAARRQKGSNRQRKAHAKAAKYQRYGKDVRRDVAHKASRRLVDQENRDLFVFEDLKIKNMSKSAKGDQENPGRNVKQKAGLNRSILESGWGQLKDFTTYKARREGKLVISVNPRFSSQECRICGFTSKDNRRIQAEFVCSSCGHAENADFNAAGVIKKRGVAALIAGEIKFKVPKKCGIRKKSGQDCPTQKPVGEVVRRGGRKPTAQASVIRETPTTRAKAV